MLGFAELMAGKLATGDGIASFARHEEQNPFLFACFMDCLCRSEDIPPERQSHPRAIEFRRRFAFYRTVLPQRPVNVRI